MGTNALASATQYHPRANYLQKTARSLWSPRRLTSFSLLAYRIAILVPFVFVFIIAFCALVLQLAQNRYLLRQMPQKPVLAKKWIRIAFGVIVVAAAIYFAKRGWKSSPNPPPIPNAPVPQPLPIPPSSHFSQFALAGALTFPVLASTLGFRLWKNHRDNLQVEWAKTNPTLFDQIIKNWGSWESFVSENKALGKRISLGEKMGEGSQAKVYRAELDGKPVVVKINHPTDIDLQCIVREILMTERLPKSDLFPKYRGFYLLGRGKIGLITEHFQGEPLYSEKNGIPALSMMKIFKIAKQALTALSKLQKRDIIHSDFRPPNLMRDPITEKLQVIDYGLAHGQGLPPPIRAFTQTGSYRALEVILESDSYLDPQENPIQPLPGPLRSITPAIDIWSLGISLVELSTRQPFFSDRLMEELEKSLQLPLVGGEYEADCLQNYNQTLAATDCKHLLELEKILGKKLDEDALVHTANWKYIREAFVSSRKQEASASDRREVAISSLKNRILHAFEKKQTTPKQPLTETQQYTKFYHLQKTRQFIKLLGQMLEPDYKKRISPQLALQSPIFQNISVKEVNHVHFRFFHEFRLLSQLRTTKRRRS